MKTLGNEFLRRKYADMRFGQGIVFPIISMINFLIISINLTTILKIFLLWLFIIMFIFLISFALIFIGYLFRKFQLPIDFKLGYERSIEGAKTDRIILDGILTIIDKSSSVYPELMKRRNYLKQIEGQNFNKVDYK